MVTRLDILINKIFPVKHNLGDVNRFIFLQLTYKVKDGGCGLINDHHYRFVYIRNGNYIVHKVTYPFQMDFNYYLGELRNKLGMSTKTLANTFLLEVTSEFTQAASNAIKKYKDIVKVLNHETETATIQQNSYQVDLELLDIPVLTPYVESKGGKYSS
jgi:hypothetical protein